MGPYATSAYSATFRIVDLSTPQSMWLVLSRGESDQAFAQYIEDGLATESLSDFRLEESLEVEDTLVPDVFVSEHESALFKSILLSSVNLLDD